MRKVLSIILVILLLGCSVLTVSCGRKEISKEEFYEVYIKPIKEKVDKKVYNDFDFTASIKNSNGDITWTTRVIYYTNTKDNSDPFLYISTDNTETEGIDYQRKITISSDEAATVYEVYEIEAGEENVRKTEIAVEDFDVLMANIYQEYFVDILPKSADDIIDRGRLLTYINYEIKYPLTIDDVEYDCVMTFNTQTDNIHEFKAATGEGDALTSFEIAYNYPKFKGNLFVKDIPSHEDMIKNAKTKTPVTEASTEPTQPTDPSAPEQSTEQGE